MGSSRFRSFVHVTIAAAFLATVPALAEGAGRKKSADPFDPDFEVGGFTVGAGMKQVDGTVSQESVAVGVRTDGVSTSENGIAETRADIAVQGGRNHLGTEWAVDVKGGVKTKPSNGPVSLYSMGGLRFNMGIGGDRLNSEGELRDRYGRGTVGLVGEAGIFIDNGEGYFLIAPIGVLAGDVARANDIEADASGLALGGRLTVLGKDRASSLDVEGLKTVTGFGFREEGSVDSLRLSGSLSVGRGWRIVPEYKGMVVNGRSTKDLLPDGSGAPGSKGVNQLMIHAAWGSK